MLDFEKELFKKGFKLIVGCDEAGRGPLCGPVVCAACILPPSYQNEMINDSKKLTDKKRKILFEEIKEIRFNNNFEEVNLNYINKIFENGVINKAKGGVLDIGANIGNHALYFALEGNADFVYAFEPIEDTFKILKRNVEINNLENKISLFNCAVGAKHVMTTITNYHDDNIGGTQLAYSDKGNIECITIDDMRIKKDIKLIKIDVEGFEAEVIIGARRTIAEKQPYILVEIWSIENMQIIESILKPLGYQYIQIALHDYLFYKME